MSKPTAAVLSVLVLGATVYAQVGRGGSEWLTAGADAQRTSWIRTDPKISVESMSSPGFELQWTAKLDNRARQLNGLTQGVTANGVTLFVPMSIIGGSSNNVFAIDNDTGYVVWQRHFDVAIPAPTPGCPAGMTAAATRIVPLVPPPITVPPSGGGRAVQAYRSVIGEPGQGVPIETRGGGPGRGPAAPGAPNPAGAAPPAPGPQRQGGDPAGRGAAPAPAGGGGGGGGGRGNAGPAIPGAPPITAGGLGRPSGVVYAISSDGVLHVMGLQSGKDIQRPAEFFPANARWSDAIAVNTTLYTSTSGSCAGAPNGVWGIDLDSDAKPVVSWKSKDDLVGTLAFTSDGTVVIAEKRGIVLLDGKTLQEKGSFSASGAELVTGPTVFRHHDKEIVAAGTKDGRIVLVDATASGGASRSTPLYVSNPVATGGSIVDGLASWQEMTIVPPPPPPPASPTAPPGPIGPPAPANVTLGARWILAPVTGAVVALKLTDSNGALALEPAWTARNFSAPSTPIVVNGVVFALSTGRPATAGAGTPAALRAFEGTTGKLLWDSGTAMKAFASPGSFWSAMGQLYVGTADGAVYAFGFADERR
jgi:outer membrane protein assembly factor BamB